MFRSNKPRNQYVAPKQRQNFRIGRMKGQGAIVKMKGRS